MKELSCRLFLRELDDACDAVGTRPDRLCLSVTAADHARQCPGCRKRMRAYLLIAGAFAPVPARPRDKRWVASPVWIALAASLLVAVGVSVVARSNQQPVAAGSMSSSRPLAAASRHATMLVPVPGLGAVPLTADRVQTVWSEPPVWLNRAAETLRPYTDELELQWEVWHGHFGEERAIRPATQGADVRITASPLIV